MDDLKDLILLVFFIGPGIAVLLGFGMGIWIWQRHICKPAGRRFKLSECVDWMLRALA